MEEAGIKAELSNSNTNQKWEESSCGDLPKLVESIRKVKGAVNDYLTDLVNKEKGSVDKHQKNVENPEEEEGEEEVVEDRISGFIKETVGSDEVTMGSKRKVQANAKLKAKKRK